MQSGGPEIVTLVDQPEAVETADRGQGRFDRMQAGSVAASVLIAAAVALVLGLIRLGNQSLWVDEAFTARAVRSSLPDLYEQLHWFYYSLAKPWTSVAGTSEWALRMPSVVGAMAACGLMVVLAHKLFDRWVALASGLFLATNPFLVKWSQQARSYTLLLAASLLATLLLIRALDRGSRAAWFSYGVAFTVVLFFHPVSGLALVPAHAVLILQRRDGLTPHGLVAANVIVGLGATWVAVVALWTRGEETGISWITSPTPAVVADALLWISGAAGLGILLAGMGFWVLHRAGRADLAVWLGVWAIGPFVFTVVASAAKPMFVDRYLIVAAPAFALLAGVAVTGIGSRLRAVIVPVIVIATSISLVVWYSHGSGNNWRGEGWSRAVTAVLERQGDDSRVLVVPWWANPAASYYGARVQGVVSGENSIWALVWSEEGHEIPKAERRGLGFGEYRLVEKLQFGWRVSAQRWERPSR
jgi:mannosyltransferase